MLIQERIHNIGAEFKSLTEVIDTTTPAGRMIFQILGAFAEFERAIIRERTMIGLRAARDRGNIGGQPPKIADHELDIVLQLREKGLSLRAIGKRFGVHMSSVRRALERINASPQKKR
ncbi:recombinase family protein [Limnohabitans sp.]|uniref:recombinase family protein n=1 Tax=Limnohabitans sp. TaxID=1907725 RepID=UPI00286FA5CC|nr:recombinase family protein [Limnohabitans sp.]